MVPSILSLPPELKYLIGKLLVLSSELELKSLAALARTHTAYRREAEKALYDTLYIYADRDRFLKCMETLAKNLEKAALVRFLTIEYANDNTKKNRRVTTYLSKSLINMHALSDFRVKSCVGGVETQLIKGLGKILCQGHFRLQSFYCHDVLNISRIIKCQTELQILGLYYTRRSRGSTLRNLLKTLKEFYNVQLFLPIVLTMEHGSFSTNPDHISIFPAFYSVNRRSTIPQVLVQSFGDKYVYARDSSFLGLSIYLFDSSDMPSIYALAMDVSTIFPRIGWINLMFERRCAIPLQEIKERLSFFSNLSHVRICDWSSI